MSISLNVARTGLTIAATLIAVEAFYRFLPSAAPAERVITRYRLTASWRALRGHPVAYRVSLEGGGITVSGHHSIISGCVSAGRAEEQEAFS